MLRVSIHPTGVPVGLGQGLRGSLPTPDRAGEATPAARLGDRVYTILLFVYPAPERGGPEQAGLIEYWWRLHPVQASRLFAAGQ